MMLKIVNVTKRYDDCVALNNVSLEIDSGFNIIVGQSGSGKSSLLNIIGTLDLNFDGDVFLDDFNYKNGSEKEINLLRNEKIGFVFQNFFLEPKYSVYDNVALPMMLKKLKKEEVKERVTKVLDEVGLADKMYKKACELSGGEMQRVAIARAFVNKPNIILADEPSGNLDSKNGLVVMELLKKAVDNGCVVVRVTHNNEHLVYGDRIIEIKDGEITNDLIK